MGEFIKLVKGALSPDEKKYVFVRANKKTRSPLEFPPLHNVHL